MKKCIVFILTLFSTVLAFSQPQDWKKTNQTPFYPVDTQKVECGVLFSAKCYHNNLMFDAMEISVVGFYSEGCSESITMQVRIFERDGSERTVNAWSFALSNNESYTVSHPARLHDGGAVGGIPPDLHLLYQGGKIIATYNK